VKGSWDGAVLKAVCTGGVLRRLLDGLETAGGQAPAEMAARGHKSADAATLADFLNSVEDDARYAISGFDF
jgi:hypothetical protein